MRCAHNVDVMCLIDMILYSDVTHRRHIIKCPENEVMNVFVTKNEIYLISESKMYN